LAPSSSVNRRPTRGRAVTPRTPNCSVALHLSAFYVFLYVLCKKRVAHICHIVADICQRHDKSSRRGVVVSRFFCISLAHRTLRFAELCTTATSAAADERPAGLTGQRFGAGSLCKHLLCRARKRESVDKPEQRQQPRMPAAEFISWPLRSKEPLHNSAA